MGDFELFFVRDKEKREVDFLIVRDGSPWILIECKSKGVAVGKHLDYFSKQLKTKYNYQLIDQKKTHKKLPLRNIEIMDYETFFSGWV
jgi:uncharacterized protein